MCHMRRRIHARMMRMHAGRMRMRRRIHVSYGEEDTCAYDAHACWSHAHQHPSCGCIMSCLPVSRSRRDSVCAVMESSVST
jgi:hypothetical protein